MRDSENCDSLIDKLELRFDVTVHPGENLAHANQRIEASARLNAPSQLVDAMREQVSRTRVCTVATAQARLKILLWPTLPSFQVLSSEGDCSLLMEGIHGLLGLNFDDDQTEWA